MKKVEKEAPVHLEFSKKYDLPHSRHYYEKHRTGVARRLTNWREQSIARKALQLAGRPQTVLDIPCGTGRFWPLLCEERDRRILAADQSDAMLQIARDEQDTLLVNRIHCFQTSAFAIDLEDGAVECIFSMRLLHHIGDARHRAQLFREFHRVASDSVCISLWVDGNYKAMRRRKLDARRKRAGRNKYQNRFVIPRKTIELEFHESGFRLTGKFDLLKYYAMWRIYVLRKAG